MRIQQYLESVTKRFKSGISREHSYRGDLESLIREIVKGVVRFKGAEPNSLSTLLPKAKLYSKLVYMIYS